MAEEDFLKTKHIQYFKRCLGILPDSHSADPMRLTIAYFSISGLDILDSFQQLVEEPQKICDWIYSLQVLPSENNDFERCGFRGTFSTCECKSTEGSVSQHMFDNSSLPMTYTGLALLIMLGDDLSRIKREAVIGGVAALQRDEGSFKVMRGDSENDMRFVYCAACICYFLNDWTGIDCDKMAEYIRRSLSYEGGFAQKPGLEAHGGSTFCALASLCLMGQLHSVITEKQQRHTIRWLLHRQQSGFNGRPNKAVDTCYSFWVGASLSLLNAYKFVDKNEIRDYNFSTQGRITGGFGKWPDNSADPLHAYLGMCGLSLLKQPGVKPMHVALNISEKAADSLAKIHSRWISKAS